MKKAPAKSATRDSKSTCKSSPQVAEFPNGHQLILWSREGKGGGYQCVVPNPKECTTFDHMLNTHGTGRNFVIAGALRRICGVCPYSFHVPPYAVGIPILLECIPAEKKK